MKETQQQIGRVLLMGIYLARDLHTDINEPTAGLFEINATYSQNAKSFLRSTRARSSLRPGGTFNHLRGHRVGDSDSGGSALALKLIVRLAATAFALPLVAAVEAADVDNTRDAGFLIARKCTALVAAKAQRSRRGDRIKSIDEEES